MTPYWFSLLLVLIAVVMAVFYLRARRAPLLFLTIAVALIGAGGFLPTLLLKLKLAEDPLLLAWWLGALALVTLFVMCLVVIVSGMWWAPLAYASSVIFLLAVGAVSGESVSRGLLDLWQVLIRLEAVQPWWLLLLGLVPLIVYFSFRSLAGLGPIRRWIAIGLRCLLVILLTLALAEVRLRHSNESLTVLFLVDRSLSIPEDPDPKLVRHDLRWDRVKRLINESVEKRGSAHDRDKVGVIVFGRRPRLELPPSSVPRLNFEEVTSIIDPMYTDIGAAIKLALASFPESSAKRIVLISDGNENLGNAEEQARVARQNGVQIDVVPVASGFRNENEVLVQSVEAPAVTEQSSQVPIRVLIRSYNSALVEGIVSLRQVVGGVGKHVEGSPRKVILRPGLNSITFKQGLTKQQESYTYEAVFDPERVLNEKGEMMRAGLPGDRVQNNRATTHVIALGRRRILFIEPKVGDHQLLVDHLARVGESRFKIHQITPDELPRNKAELAVFLSNYDCVILANVPASDVAEGNVGEVVAGTITEEQQEIIRSNTHDQGCGLIMIGGLNGFGAGGWQGTPIEKALPVDCEIKSIKIQGKGGLVLIMHACEMADGNQWEKKIAQLALKKLSPMDEFGIIQWNGTDTWVIPLQVIGEKRETLMRRIDRMTPNDMPDFSPGLKMAYDSLTDPKRELATKHVIIISDGDPQSPNAAFLSKMKASKVTVTTVGIATHGAPQDQTLANIAKATGGRYYNVKSAKALPSIYIKESRLVSQSFVYEKAFKPRYDAVLGGPLEGLDNFPSLYGFVRTTPKQSVLVHMPLLGPPTADQDFPILAYWHYGLGKSVVFTSDARSLEERGTWDRDWAHKWDKYTKFWEQVVGWAVRSVETGKLAMTTEYRDGKVRVMVDARDKDNKPLTDLIMRGGVTTPSPQGDTPRKMELEFKQTNSGIYEAEFKADEAGSYFILAQPTREIEVVKDGKKIKIQEGVDSVRAGVTIPYSPEFADLESNTALLEKVRDITGGQTIAETDEAITAAIANNEVFRHADLPKSRSLQPIWHWLLLVTALLLFFDIAVRRIAVDPIAVMAASQAAWEKLRGRAAAVEASPQFLDRLKSRKAQIGETLEKARSAQRFDADTAAPISAPPPGADETSSAPAPLTRARPAPGVAPDKQEEAADFASRLMKAKKRVWEEREKDK